MSQGKAEQEPGDFELVLVTYNSRPQVEGLLAGLPAGVPLVIVDNSGDQDGVSTLAATRPGTRYLDGGGRGFAHAANLGASTSGHEYVVFVNPDSRPTLGDLEELVRSLDKDPEAASVAATMLGPAGEIEIGVGGWEPDVRRALVHSLGLHKKWPRAGLFAKPEPNEAIALDWTTGACMAVRTVTFASLGRFDERFYVYNEDMAFGRTARAAGLTQVLRTDVLVPHAAGGSGAPSLEMLRLRGASMAQYVRRYHGAGPATAIRGALTLGYLLRVGQHLLQRDKPRTQEHLAYVKGVVTAKAFVGGQEVTRG